MPGRRRHRRPGFTASPTGVLLVFIGIVLAIFALSYYLGYWSPDPSKAISPDGSKGLGQGATLEEQTPPFSPPPTKGSSPGSSPMPRSAPSEPEQTGEPSSVPRDPEAVATVASESLPNPPPGRGVRVALVIDDLGRSLQDLKTLGSLGIDLTYAVLPFESRTPEVVAELRRRREEILCHLPMEPSNGANPGPGALRGSMSDEDLIAGTRKALAAVPGSVGVNNHMGSGLTTDILRMTAIVEVLKERRLFFLDSRTSAQSVGYKAAVEAGIPAAERQVFLDGDPAPEVIREQFRRTLEIARRRGAAVAIGHPYPETLAVLGEEVPRALQLGYDFVPVSFLLDRSGDLEE